MFPSLIDFAKCREEIAGHGALQEFLNRWFRQVYIESNTFNSTKLNMFNIIDKKSFYCKNLGLLTTKSNFTLIHLNKGAHEFHRKFVLAPAD